MTHNRIERLKDDVEQHGEVHAYIDDVGKKDIRLGEVSFNSQADLITIDDGQTEYRWAIDHIIGWYLPRG